MSGLEKAREIVADALGLELAEVTANATMETVADWDSLQHLAVVTALEADLAVTLSPEQVTELSSVAMIAELIDAGGPL